MKTRFFSTVRFLVLSLFVFFPLRVNASGFIIIDTFFPRCMTVKKYDVKVSINKQIATTEITQIFHNPNDYDVEGTYIFPISEAVSIENFTMHVNEEPLTARILTKEKAREIYEGIVLRSQDPALLEYIGCGMIQASVYPIHSHSDLRISFKYSEILTANDGSIKYRFSLGTDKNFNVVLDDVSILVNIVSEENIVNVYSPTHELSIKRNSQTKVTVSCEEKNAIANRDFILYYTLPHDDIGFNVLTYNKDQEDGFFLAMMSPNVNEGNLPVIAKNIVFVVDTSGSMLGEKMQQAKDALKFCLQNLNEQDHFNIISFDYDITMYNERLVEANVNQIQQANAFVDSLNAYGCTNIDEALEAALNQLPKCDNPNMIIFLTDGQPTVGECNVSCIIQNAKQRNIADTRIFSFGVGYDVNTALLDKISLDNKGVSDYVCPSESIETVVSGFYKKIANPVLTDLLFKVVGTDVKEIFPICLPDLFYGSQLLVLGRYTKGGDITIDLSGKQNTFEKQYFFKTRFADNDISNDFLPRLWASRKIAYLIDKIVLYGEQLELVEEIARLSKKYGIITEYTSFLIDVGAADFIEDSILEEMFSDSSKSQCFVTPVQNQVGKQAVNRAKSRQCLRDGSTLSSMFDVGCILDGDSPCGQGTIRAVGDRTFYLKDDIWIDADYVDSLPTTKIKLFSKEYFELLKKNTEIGACFSLGKNVIIKTETGAIWVHDDGE